MGEAGAALLLGLVVGLIMKAGGVEHTVAHAVEFRVRAGGKGGGGQVEEGVCRYQPKLN